MTGDETVVVPKSFINALAEAIYVRYEILARLAQKAEAAGFRPTRYGGEVMAVATFRSDFTVKLVQHVGDDVAICAAAKVSVEGAASLEVLDREANAGLIRFLMAHRHGTPFEHGSLTFFVTAPIFVWREFHRHRIGFSYNEESGRYKVLEPVFYLPHRDRPMMKVDGWKPGRPKFLRDESGHVWKNVCERLAASYQIAYQQYIHNLEDGIDPGLARDCLPVGIYSSCYVTCNPRSLMAFLSLRIHNHEAKFVSYPLWEIEQVARQLETLARGHWPLTLAAFDAAGRVGP